MDSVDFYLKWEWQFSRPRTQCGRTAGICVCVWMLQICVVYTSITEQLTRTHRFAHVRTRNIHAHPHRIVSVMINGRRVWIAHWRRHQSGGSALRVRVVWRTGVCSHATLSVTFRTLIIQDKDVRWPEGNSLRRGELDYCLENARKNPIFTNLKEKIRAHRASCKATRLFLTK